MSSAFAGEVIATVLSGTHYYRRLLYLPTLALVCACAVVVQVMSPPQHSTWCQDQKISCSAFFCKFYSFAAGSYIYFIIFIASIDCLTAGSAIILICRLLDLLDFGAKKNKKQN